MVDGGELWCEADAKAGARPVIGGGGGGGGEARYGGSRGGLTDVADNCPDPKPRASSIYGALAVDDSRNCQSNR